MSIATLFLFLLTALMFWGITDKMNDLQEIQSEMRQLVDAHHGVIMTQVDFNEEVTKALKNL